ncbi:MAG: peroxiredoxin family protein [Thermoleophilia bacterium]
MSTLDPDPRVREALDRFQPAPGDARADWGDVRRRAAAHAPRRRLRRAGAIALGAAGALAGIVLIALLIVQGPSGDRPADLRVGDAAPDVTFPVVYPDPTHGLRDPETRLSSLRGQVVVLSFIDTGCPGCRAAADRLGLVTMLPASALIVVSGEPAPDAEHFATAPFTVTRQTGEIGKAFRGIATAADPDGAIGRAFGVGGHPTIILIDRRGRIARRYDEVPSGRALQRAVQSLVAQPAPAGLPAAQPLQPHLSVFDDPATAWDGSPAIPGGVPCPYVPGSVRVAATGDRGEALLLAHGIDGWAVIMTVDGPGGGGGSGCGAPRTAEARAKELRRIRNRGWVAYMAGGVKGRYVFSLVTLDGYDRIRIDGVTYPVPHNGFIRTFPARPSRVVISGPAGERRVRVP